MKNVNNNNMRNNNMTEGVYIPNIEACWLYKENVEHGDYKIDREYLEKMLSGKLDYSFELVANDLLLDNVEVREFNGKLYTLDIINVKYNSRYNNINAENEKSTKDLRNWSYEEGFTFNGKLFNNWKRSTGKARGGENLFIIDSIVDGVLEWARMGLDFIGEVDIASVRAYESLPLSSIIGTIDIEPESILVIDDYESVFNWEMSKTELVDKELVTTLADVKEVNDIWDGQGLMDKSIFDDNELINDKGFALLRNRYFKCAAFSTNISEYYENYCKENGLDYETFTVTNLYGKEMLAKDIKLITTPNSIKIDKFANEVRVIDGYDYNNSWLDFWFDNCGRVFGVCMTEKPSRFENGKYNRLSYQMVNTVPFNRCEVTELAKKEVNHIERLKNDLDYFLEAVNVDVDDNLEINRDNHELTKGKRMDVIGAFTEMVKLNTEFSKTSVFKEYRKSYIDGQVRDLRQGKLRVEGDYAFIVGNPIEMLLATVGDFDGKEIALSQNSMYCPNFINEQDVVGFRSPHVCEGNVANLVNRQNNLIDKYMNLTNNIVVTNNINYPIQTLLQGQDQDGDTMLLTNNDIVVRASKRIDWSVTPIPTNAIANSGANNAELTGTNMSAIDHVISQNFIGEDVNLSQELNSLLNHKRNNKQLDNAERNSLYTKISKCSSISCVEIDKAKRQFADLSVTRELAKAKKGMDTVADAHDLSEEDNRRVKPLFFKYIGDTRARKQRQLTNRKHRELLDEQTKFNYAMANNIPLDELDTKGKELKKLIRANAKVQREWEDMGYIAMDTPMDWLQEEVDSIGRARRMKTLQVIQLVKRNYNKHNQEIVDSILDIIKKTDLEVRGYILDGNLDYKTMRSKVDRAKKVATEDIREKKLSKANMYWVMRDSLNSVKNNGKLDKRTGIESISLELLFMAYGTSMLSMFKKSNK